MHMALRIGVDVGGTFTDFVAYSAASGALEVWKTLSTPHDPSDGIVNGLAQSPSVESISHLRFGTTIATNAILERKGATVAFVTTRGFRDVPFIQRGKRKSHYDITWVKAKPLVKRQHCFEIDERITPREGIYRALDEAQARAVARSIAADPSVDAIAICLLCSYVIPDHERRVSEIFAEECPHKPLSISFELLPKWKEYERASTTIADAYVKPLVTHNLATLERRLRERGNVERVVVIKSNGGEFTLEAAQQAPIQLSLSGPTGGVVGARHIARLAGVEHLVTLDMGGTSTDVSTVVGGRESFTTSFEIEFGIPIQIPMLDIRTMGAGGGSIAWIDKGGMLQVGPQSAGARPGPACYGQGGTAACVTDANVVLGRINPAYFLGGAMHLDAGAARAAVATLGARIEREVDDAALGIVQIANNNMVGALRMVLTERGLDPRDFTLLAFGGAGPVHVCDLMHLAGIPRAIVPNHPGQFSAFGFIMTDARIDLERTSPMTSKSFNAAHAERVLDELTSEALAALARQGHTRDIELFRAVEMRYFGQNHELDVTLDFERFDAASIARLWSKFHAAHKARYNFEIPGETIELISIKLTAVAHTAKPALPKLDPARPPATALARRAVRFDHGVMDTAVFARDALAAGQRIAGPALIEEAASVTVLRPDYALEVDAYGNLLLGAKH
jgi:N-methylhydantoinase A